MGKWEKGGKSGKNWVNLLILLFTSFINGKLTEIKFCFVYSVLLIIFNESSTSDLIAYIVKSGLL